MAEFNFNMEFWNFNVSNLMALLQNSMEPGRYEDFAASVPSFLTYEEKISLSEQYIYGSQRLGTKRGAKQLQSHTLRYESGNWLPEEVNVLAEPVPAYVAQAGGLVDVGCGLGTWLANGKLKYPQEATYTRKVGLKEYELSNHLGNIQATILDRRLGIKANPSDTTFSYVEADVKTAQDYYPFGMLMPGRSYTTGTASLAYRYGFNGQERDDEIKGSANSLDFGARIYDPRLGKFLSVDPMIKNYPSFSSYSFAGNSPIVLIDKKGEFPWVTGLIGAGVNIAIGYIGAKLNDQEYSAKDALIDGAIGFSVGSGAALFAPVLGITTATTTTGRIVQGALTGMGTGFISNALDQGTRIAIGDQEEWSNSQLAISGVGGLFGGAAAAGMGRAAEKFMSKVGDKMLRDFTKGELNQYIKYQTKFLKIRIEQQTGARVGKRQLQREVEKVAEEWKDIKVSEINFVKISTEKAAKAAGEVTVTLSTVQTANKVTEK